MRKSERFEFSDLDGNYIFVETIDETRCRVILSNLARPGKILHLPADLFWKNASEDLGGYTQLLPCEMLDYNRELTADEPGEDDFEESLAQAIDHEDEVVRETHARVEARVKSRFDDPEPEAWQDEDFVDAYIRSLERKRRKESG